MNPWSLIHPILPLVLAPAGLLLVLAAAVVYNALKG